LVGDDWDPTGPKCGSSDLTRHYHCYYPCIWKPTSFTPP